LREQQQLVGFGLGVAGEDELAPVGGWEMHVEHLDRRELVERLVHGEPWCTLLELILERDVQAVGKEGDEDVRFDASFFLMEDRADGQIAFEILEPRSGS
jgi:hypothetical protein